MTKIYMAGCGGMLGLAFYKEFKDSFSLKCSDIDTNEDWLEYLDFRDYESYLKEVEDYSADWLVHLGAHTDLEFCELNVDEAYETNTVSVQHAVKISNRLKIPLLYISTAGIFGGEKDFYDESDEPKPLGHYGRSKYLGEDFVQKNSKDYLICRAGWMMGGGPKKDKKFIQKIINQIENGQKTLHVVNDKLGTPTYTHDFAKNSKILIENNQRGLFNMVCGGLTGRLEVATELVTELGLKKEIEIEEVTSEFFKEEYFAERPDCECLINKRLNDLGLNKMRDWKIALKECIKEYYPHYL